MIDNIKNINLVNFTVIDYIVVFLISLALIFYTGKSGDGDGGSPGDCGGDCD